MKRSGMAGRLRTQGKFDRVVALRSGKIVDISLKEASISARGMGICLAGGIKTTMPPFRTALVGRCGFLYLLEEGCHSAGFDTTIHKRHHLLLSLGWRFNLFAPE